MWSDSEAQAYVEKYKQKGVLDDVALRVYSARLIGSDSNRNASLHSWILNRFVVVLHGGGNCSVKVEVPNAVGEKITWLAIKGSGWDLSNIGTSRNSFHTQIILRTRRISSRRSKLFKVTLSIHY